MVGRVGVTSVLEADLSGTDYTDPPTFTDLTAAIRGSQTLTCKWGRQAWTGPGAASLSCQLKNPDGDFTPGLSTGTYYPNVRRRNRLRYGLAIPYTGGLTFTDAGDHWAVTASSGVVEFPDHFEFAVGTWVDAGDHWEVDTTLTTIRYFDGQVTSWDASYEDGVYPVCDVDAADFLGRLGRSTPLLAMPNEEVMRDGPTSYYPLNDSGPTGGDLLSAAPPLAAAGNVTWQSPAPVADDSITGVYLHGPGSSLYWTAAQRITGCFEMFVSTHSNAAFEPFVTSTGGHTTLVEYGDGQPHQVVIDNTGAVSVDGGPFVGSIGTSIAALGVNFLGTIWGVAFYPTVLSPARLAEHREAVLTGFAGESTADRVARLLSYRPNFGLVPDTTEGNVGVQQTLGVTVQQALFDTSDVEQGVIFADGDQRIVFRSRSRVFNPAPTISLDVSKVSGGTRFVDSIDGLLNDVTITRTGGATVRVIVPDSITKDGSVATTLNLIVDTDLNALQLAGWIAGNGAAEQVASPSLGIDLYRETDAAIVTAVLALQPLDVVELAGLPDTAPAPTVRYVVQGGELTATSESLSVTLYTTALPLPVFMWDDLDHGWDSGSVWAP